MRVADVDLDPDTVGAPVKAALTAVGFAVGTPREPVAGLAPAAAGRITELASALRPVPTS